MTVLRDEQRRHYCAIVAPVRNTARGGGGGGSTPLKEANLDVPLDGVAFRMESKIFGFWG